MSFYRCIRLPTLQASTARQCQSFSIRHSNHPRSWIRAGPSQFLPLRSNVAFARCVASGIRASSASPDVHRPSAFQKLDYDTAKVETSAGAALSSSDPSTRSTWFFPKASSKSVAYWLLASAASVFGLVVFGGLTRLTESGLSITEWRPVTGSLPPLSAADWDSEFEKYRASPEFKLLNPHMTLSEFKKIYYMEWTHRQWGRLVGLTFVVPAVFFVARGRVSGPMAVKLAGIAGLIGFQGVLGWWMVKSGLKDDLFAPGSHPRVSQYRLAAHLGTAFLCYTAMLWNGLSILLQNRVLRDAEAALKDISAVRSSSLKVFRRSVGGLACLVFLTAMSGGLVAGLDAGMIYNDFPYMGVGLTPPRSELFSDFYCRSPDRSDLWWRNMLENPSTVQLDHRILAGTTFTAIMTLWVFTRFSPRVRTALPKHVRSAVRGVVHLVWLQVTLGISTLIYLVPVPLAAAHQAGALALLSGVVVLGSRVWIPRRTIALAKGIVSTTSRSKLAATSTSRPVQNRPINLS